MLNIKFLLVAVALVSRAWGADGFATVNGNTTGGEGGVVVTVTNSADFIQYATRVGPHIIRVQGTIAFGTAAIKSHKTIVGIGANPTLRGELQISGVSNVVVQNLIITNPGPGAGGTGDGVRIYNGSHHIWVGHCSIYDCSDGLCDITNGSDYVTVSWCKFYYTQQTEHRFSMLVASSDTDAGQYRITLHHNWWAQGCDQRMPMSRYGTIHLYNNYYSATNNSYCSNARTNAQFFSENNFYAGVDDPIYKTSNGRIRTSGNLYRGCTGLIDGGSDAVFTPPYAYTSDVASEVPAIVQAGAGLCCPKIAPERRADTLRLSWPPDHIGWQLESQTAASDWIMVEGSNVTNEVSIPINSGHGRQFFRLVFR